METYGKDGISEKYINERRKVSQNSGKKNLGHSDDGDENCDVGTHPTSLKPQTLNCYRII